MPDVRAARRPAHVAPLLPGKGVRAGLRESHWASLSRSDPQFMGMQSDSYSEPSPSTVVLTFGQLWQVPTFFLGLVLLGTVWTTRPYWYDPESLHFQHELS